MRKHQLIKERLKVLVKSALSGRSAGLPSGRILTYHSVGERDHAMNVEPRAFAEQMAWLADAYPCRTVEQVLNGGEGVAITFDDGYRDNLANALPVLARHGIPWTLFFVAGRAGSLLDHDRDPATSTLLDWNEVRELHAAGVEIGAHTMTHARLSGLDEGAQREEINGSFARISEELNAPPAGFAYPYGSALDYSPSTVAIVQECGFSYAVSNRYGPCDDGDRFTARRIWIDRTDTLEFFRAKVEGRLDRLRILDSGPGILARRMLNRFS